MIEVKLKGNTFGIKETLKGLGFKWNSKEKCWARTFKDSEETIADEIATRWYSEGVYGKVTKH
jgi:hypothetical protein